MMSQGATATNGSGGATTNHGLSVASGGPNNSQHHTGMGMSSGGQNMRLLNMVESGDADDGGRDGETRYFNDVTQDEGTGGESYTLVSSAQSMSHHHHLHHHHDSIPQSSSGISGG